MADIDLDALEKLAQAAAADMDTPHGDEPECRGCGSVYTIVEPDHEATPFCDSCAQRIVVELGRGVLAMARRTEQAERERDEARAEASKWRRAGFDGIDNMAEALGRTQTERDEARAALTEACDIGWFFAGDGDEPDALAVVRAHALRIAELRKIAAGTPARAPLDPPHVEVLRGMLDHERANRGAAQHAQIRHMHDERVAALKAVLGEEARS